MNSESENYQNYKKFLNLIGYLNFIKILNLRLNVLIPKENFVLVFILVSNRYEYEWFIKLLILVILKNEDINM